MIFYKWALEEIGAPYKAFILEEVAPRPLVDLPAVIAEDETWTRVSGPGGRKVMMASARVASRWLVGLLAVVLGAVAAVSWLTTAGHDLLLTFAGVSALLHLVCGLVNPGDGRVVAEETIDDLKRLHERVMKLQQHHTQSGEDLRQILISAEKVEKVVSPPRKPVTSSSRHSGARCGI